MLTQNELKQLLHYDPEAGIFTWLPRADLNQTWNTRFAGKRAGWTRKCRDSLFYRPITIGGKTHLEHRLAFVYMTGRTPDLVDHINGDGTDNRWDNLRPATASRNSMNHGRSKNNTSGQSGVRWVKKIQKWNAFIYVNGNYMSLGYHPDFDNAVIARLHAETWYFREFRRAE